MDAGEGRGVVDVVRLRQVTKSFGERVALNVHHLDLSAGSTTAIIGPNGAGKTTLLRILCGVWHPTTAQELQVLGNDLTQRGRKNPVRGDVGLVGDPAGLYGTLTVRENVDYAARLLGVPRRARAQRIKDALATTGIEHRSNDPVWQLSTGLKQRTTMARALVSEPRILLLDEPTRGLDPVAVQRLYDTIVQLNTRGVAVVLCTHIMQEVSDLCDQVVFLHHGRIIQAGTPQHFLDQIGQVAFTVAVPEHHVERVQRDVAAAGAPVSTSRRSEGGMVNLTLFDCPDPRVLDSLGLTYQRRPVHLTDAFFVFGDEQ